MDKRILAVIPLALVLLMSGCTSMVTNPICGNDCRETTLSYDGDIGEVSTIDGLSCKPSLNEECRILDAHWKYIEPHSMEGEYFIHCECCKIVET